ncbi:PQQ-dependent sugar dehydrogenase [Mucilaginibacter auburnensis]|uniref:Glucose/arabinose dehydrogenase n=1 Tax=Mucilaginibacter auburnensis TaxID=1457233 RepID=A0A2H9VTQ0_9SPHI|nr:sorbosone dehydrogenase family protein [Mucilaginibacter auburnensis]PJJ84191.1 glucose/arabinose dehydrogenase [Mucilaginibacter auburnensis]
MKSKALILCAVFATSACIGQNKKPDPSKAVTVSTRSGQKINLPAPYQTKSTTLNSNVVGWPKNVTPVAPSGFKVEKFAGALDNPRNIYIGPNGDVFVAEANTEVSGLKKIGADLIGKSKSQKLTESANRIILLRDENGDGNADTRIVFLTGLNKPFGMLILNNWFYVANTDGLWRFPYKTGDTKITGKGTKITDLPAGGYNNHWTRNLIANANGTKIYISVGSASNVAEHGLQEEVNRAAILEINPDGSGKRVYAGGLRNPVGMSFQPGTGTLWTAVNERDELGDELVPDYLTSVKEGGFYGWPLAYYGPHADPSYKGPVDKGLVDRAIVPDVALGAHTASLGLTFYTGKKFPAKYQNGAFVGQHGSWNRSQLSGYKVVFVPFTNGKPGIPEDFLTGFIVQQGKKDVHGRPVGVTVAKDGSLLVADDVGNCIWRVLPK